MIVWLSSATGGALGLVAYQAGGIPAALCVLAAMVYFGAVMPRLVDWELDR